MKFQLPVVLSVCLLSGCFSDTEYSESNMTLFAALYNFEPINGHVKETHFVVSSQSGTNFHDVLAKFDRNGCLMSLDVKGEPDGVISLKREGDKIVGSENNKKVVFDIGKNCLILNKKTEGDANIVTFAYNEQGSISVIKNKRPGKDYHFYYDASGAESVIDVFVAGHLVDKTSSIYPDPVNKPLDYSAQSDGTLIGKSRTDLQCQYKNKTPVSCDLVYRFIEDDSVFKFKTNINTTFY